MRLTIDYIFLAFLAGIRHYSVAHTPLGFEKERLRQDDSHPVDSFAYGDGESEDFSLAHPFDIVGSLYEGLLETPDERFMRFPTSSFFVLARLNHQDDVDYYMYDMGNSNLAYYDPAHFPSGGEYPSKEAYDFVGYTIVPACKSYNNFSPTVALIGPIGSVDVNGEKVFTDATGKEPFDVPDGYGVRIAHGKKGTRSIYDESEFTHNKWFLPVGYPEDCIENYLDPSCMDSPGVIVVQGVKYDPTTAPFYWLVYDEGKHGKVGRGLRQKSKTGKRKSIKKKLRWKKDYAMVIGTRDALLPSDYIRLGITAQFISSGRTLGEKCENPL